MKLIFLLEAGHSKKQNTKIIRYIGDDQNKFDELISFCFGRDERLAQRASWPVGFRSRGNRIIGYFTHPSKSTFPF